MLKHEIAMSRGERLVCYFLSRLPNLKLTIHHATLRFHPKHLLQDQIDIRCLFTY